MALELVARFPSGRHKTSVPSHKRRCTLTQLTEKSCNTFGSECREEKWCCFPVYLACKLLLKLFIFNENAVP